MDGNEVGRALSKICGVVSNAMGAEETEERLRSMVGVMKHDPRSPEEYLYFENGGMATIGNSAFEEKLSARNGERGSSLALCGKLVGLKNGASLSNGHNDAASATNNVAWLLGAFEEHGEGILEDLNGEFVFAHHDPKSRSLTVANDRFGMVPLYYYCKDGEFLFASEVKAILRVLGPQELDWESLADFFYLTQMTAQKTLFRDVRALDSAQLLGYRDGRLERTRYHDFAATPILEPSEVCTRKAASLFVEAVGRRTEADKPNTVMLSGGFDSRLILGALHELGVAPRLITLEGARVGGADGRLAARVAERLGLEHDLRATREDFMSSRDCLETFYIQDGMFASWEAFVMEGYPELDSGLGVVWDGLAMGASLGSSRQREPGTRVTEDNLKQFAGGRGRQVGIPSRRYRSFLLRLILTPYHFRLVNTSFMQRLRDELARIPESENQFPTFILKQRTRRRVATLPHQLFASKVKAVTPAVDADFLDYVLAIPQSLKHNHKFYVDMLRQHFPALTEVPVNSGGFEFRFDADELKKRVPPLLGDSKLRLARALLFLKISFTARLSKGQARKGPVLPPRLSRLPVELVIEILEHKNFDRPFYNKRLLRRVFRAYRNGVVFLHNLFALVFYIELWHLLFVDEDSPLLFNPRASDLPEPATKRIL